MRYTITPTVGVDYILIEVSGAINRQVGPRVISQAHRLGEELAVDKFLVDLTDAVNEDSTLDQYQFANQDLADIESFNRYAKVAALVAPADHSHDFIETVLRNVGMNFKLFRDKQAAVAYLGEDEPEG